jgi:hypothetical protein
LITEGSRHGVLFLFICNKKGSFRTPESEEL